MADALFNPGREGFLAGEIDWNTAVVKVSLIRNYAFQANHKFLSDVTGTGGVIVATATLANRTVTSGVADADDVVFTAVPTGVACNALIIYQSSAVAGGTDVADSAKRLIAYIDQASGLPVTPNGGNINITWDNGANRIFNL